MNVIWSPQALTRLTEIADTIALDNVEAAERWTVQLFRRVVQLETFPESGRVVPELEREAVRELIYGSYRIIYRVSAEAVFVLTVRHARRKFDPEEVGEE